MLKLAGEGVIAEQIERLVYNPGGAQDSGDLEPATRTITATAKQGTPDYTTSLTIPAPSDGRISVTRLGLRLQVTVDSMTAAQFNYAVHVNGTERLTGNWTGTGAKYAVVDLLSGQFNLGSANTVEVFLWVPSGNAVVSLSQVWLGVGSTSTTQFFGQECLTLSHQGLVSTGVRLAGVGTTVSYPTLTDGAFDISNYIKLGSDNLGYADTFCAVQRGVHVRMAGAGTSPLAVLFGCTFVLRREE